MFVQPLSFFDSALAPDKMLIISFIDAGLSNVLNILTTLSPNDTHTLLCHQFVSEFQKLKNI